RSDDNQADAHDDELQEVGDEHGEHPAEDSVNRDADEQRGHGDFEIFHVEPAHEHEKLAARPQEHAHVEQATQDNDYASRPANARTEAFLEHFRDGHRAGITQRFDAEAGQADESHGDGLADAGDG